MPWLMPVWFNRFSIYFQLASQPLMPRQAVSSLHVPTTDGGRFFLGAKPAEKFDLVVFYYRGLHCPIYAKYLMELERLAPEFQKRGVNLTAVSSDDEERSRKMAEKGGEGCRWRRLPLWVITVEFH